jgi:hypothetical protein
VTYDSATNGRCYATVVAGAPEDLLNSKKKSD